jgi:RNA polymerase sigma factor (sigma-70 family)
MFLEHTEDTRQIAARAIIDGFPGIEYERDDMIQDAMLRIVADAKRFDPSKGSWSTFVYSLAQLSVHSKLQADRCKCRSPEGGIRSLDEVIWTNSHRYGLEIRLMDRIADPTDYEAKCVADFEAAALYEAMDALPNERMRRVVQARWLTGEKQTLKQLAAELNVSRERVRQIEESAFRFLRKEMVKRGYGLR